MCIFVHDMCQSIEKYAFSRVTVPTIGSIYVEIYGGLYIVSSHAYQQPERPNCEERVQAKLKRHAAWQRSRQTRRLQERVSAQESALKRMPPLRAVLDAEANAWRRCAGVSASAYRLGRSTLQLRSTCTGYMYMCPRNCLSPSVEVASHRIVNASLLILPSVPHLATQSCSHTR
jgi:hypothetical protein